MVAVHSEGDTVIFTVEGWHKLWAFRSELRIPRANIKSARHDPEAARSWTGLRAVGTYVPGLITAGTFYLDGFLNRKPTFFDVQHQENTVVIELNKEHFARLIIEVEDPEAVIKLHYY